MAKHELQISSETSSSSNYLLQKEDLSFLFDPSLTTGPFGASISVLARKMLKIRFPSSILGSWTVEEIHRLLTGWPQQVNTLLDIVTGKHGDPLSTLAKYVRPLDSVVCDAEGVPSVFHQRGTVFIKNLNYTLSNAESFEQGVWYQIVPKSHPAWLLSRQIAKYTDVLPVWEANHGPLSSANLDMKE